MSVWQVQIHNWVKHKAELSPAGLALFTLWWQELVNMRIAQAIHFLHDAKVTINVWSQSRKVVFEMRNITLLMWLQNSLC